MSAWWSRRTFLVVLAIGLATVLPSKAQASPVLFVSQPIQIADFGVGLGGWSQMTDALNSAFDTASDPGNVFIGGGLDDLTTLLSYDRLWVDIRQWDFYQNPNPGDMALTPTETTNLQAFIATGRRVVLIGEQAPWATWNNSILSAVGGWYAGAGSDTSIETLSPAAVHDVTAGGPLYSFGDGTAVGGTSLFDRNVITLWGSNVISVLSVNLVADMPLDEDALQGNRLFQQNLAQWLAAEPVHAPEPATLTCLTLGLAGMAARRLKRTRKAASERSRT